MGLPSLVLNADLAATWRSVLEDNGLHVRRDEIEEAKLEEFTRQYGTGIASRRVSEVPWLVGDENGDLPVLEATYRDRDDGSVCLFFMPFNTQAGHRIFLAVEKLLIAAGATRTVKEESGKKRKGFFKILRGWWSKATKR